MATEDVHREWRRPDSVPAARIADEIASLIAELDDVGSEVFEKEHEAGAMNAIIELGVRLGVEPSEIGPTPSRATDLAARRRDGLTTREHLEEINRSTDWYEWLHRLPLESAR